MKLGRKCQLTVELGPDASGAPRKLVVAKNLTIEFEVERRFMTSSQWATFRIIGLAERTRDALYFLKDAYALTQFRAIQFRAGYDDFPIPLVFNGSVWDASSHRRGPDTVTEIRAFDGGFAMVNGFTTATIAAGQSVSSLIAMLAKSLPNVTGQPLIGDFPDKNLRGRALLGNTWSLIVAAAGGLATIDNGQVKALNPGEAIASTIPVINSASGLIGVPRRRETNLSFDMIFEPRLTVGQIVQLDSSFNRAVSGTYKVLGFSHRGSAPSTGEDPAAAVIPVVADEAQTSVSLFIGPEELRLIRGQPVQ